MALMISAREANQRFSDILGRAAEGESVIITRRGEPVARLVPYSPSSVADEDQAWDRLAAILDAGWALGGETFSRDALYDR